MANTIISAVYGTSTAGIDVTQICQTLVDTGNDDITANNATFTDPDVGATKSFAILYSNPVLNSGNPIALGCQENNTLDLVPNPPTATTPVATPGSPSFTIVHAMYGTASNGFDVTATCQWLVNNGGTVIQVNNTTFGGDPDVGALKSFAIAYTAVGGGPTFYLACAENTTLTL
jgi:hypothetical protein